MVYEFDITKLKRSQRICACGCGLPIVSNFEGSEYRMGHMQHDWRLAMELLKEAGISFSDAWWEQKASRQDAARFDPRLRL